MAFDTTAAAVGYRTTLNSYKNKIRNIQNRLNSDFNFDRNPGDDNYYDFWADLTDNTNIGDINYNNQFDTISSISQEQNDLIDAKYMNILGMVQMLDSYMCYISDSYSRMIDIAWGCVGEKAVREAIEILKSRGIEVEMMKELNGRELKAFDGTKGRVSYSNNTFDIKLLT
jgi:hypothetical protein